MGPRAKITYKKYGPSKRCRGGKGGPWANDVYIIVVKGRFQYVVFGLFLLFRPSNRIVMRSSFPQ